MTQPGRFGARSSRARFSSRSIVTSLPTIAPSSTSSKRSRGIVAASSMSVRAGRVAGIPSTLVRSLSGSESVSRVPLGRTLAVRGRMSVGSRGNGVSP